ncbi:hypothetical protein H0H93_009518 [Arthromyces matolae]|nr:hypothetical protein H0H93_009518 [Arthromyces matolae]
MASRQPPPVEVQQEVEEEDLEGLGDGDEVMDEAEEQDDGYSAFAFNIHSTIAASGIGIECVGSHYTDICSASSTPTSTLTWISWFCSLPGHEYFCEVTEDFIEDDFNLTGLNAMVPFWKEAMEMVLDVEPGEEDLEDEDYHFNDNAPIQTRTPPKSLMSRLLNLLRRCCTALFTNVISLRELGCKQWYVANTFPPYSASDTGTDIEKRAATTGAFFGTTFAHLFFQSYRELSPAPFWKVPQSGGSSLSPKSASSGSSRSSPFSNPNPHGGQKRAAGYVYVPRIYGFKVSEQAKSGPRMHWLRLRPESPSELDLVDWRGRWIDEDDQYDDLDEDGDRQMEDFDPVRDNDFHILNCLTSKQDAIDDDDDEDEEDEEEEEDDDDHRGMHGDPRGMQRSADGPQLRPPTPNLSARTSPTSSTAPRTPQDSTSRAASTYTTSPSPISVAGGKVKAVRQQWNPRATVQV